MRLPQSWHRSAKTRPQEPWAGIEPAAWAETSPADMLIRFAFGAGIALVAGLIGHLAGVHLGGLFLAFPAILPATLTLIAKDQSDRSAVHDDDGALLGGCGLAVFGLVAWWLLPRVGAAWALPASTAAWAAASGLLYFLSRLWIGEPKARPGRGGR